MGVFWLHVIDLTSMDTPLFVVGFSLHLGTILVVMCLYSLMFVLLSIYPVRGKEIVSTKSNPRSSLNIKHYFNRILTNLPALLHMKETNMDINIYFRDINYFNLFYDIFHSIACSSI